MSRAIFEAVTIIACFNNMAMVGQSIKQRGGHYEVAKHKEINPLKYWPWRLLPSIS